MKSMIVSFTFTIVSMYNIFAVHEFRVTFTFSLYVCINLQPTFMIPLFRLSWAELDGIARAVSVCSHCICPPRLSLMWFEPKWTYHRERERVNLAPEQETVGGGGKHEALAVGQSRRSTNSDWTKGTLWSEEILKGKFGILDVGPFFVPIQSVIEAEFLDVADACH